jgi:HEAT repeat protein
MEELSDILSQLSCGDDEQAELALSHMADWGSKAVVALEGRLSHPDAEVRWWAVRALVEVQDERVPGLLVHALSDPDMSVRWCAGLALRSHPSPQASKALVEMLSDHDALARRLAGDALMAIGSPVVPQLLEAMGQGNSLMRLEAVRSLAKSVMSVPSLPYLKRWTTAQPWSNIGLVRDWRRWGLGWCFLSQNKNQHAIKIIAL